MIEGYRFLRPRLPTPGTFSSSAPGISFAATSPLLAGRATICSRAGAITKTGHLQGAAGAAVTVDLATRKPVRSPAERVWPGGVPLQIDLWLKQIARVTPCAAASTAMRRPGPTWLG
jgi:hypothetical protein